MNSQRPSLPSPTNTVSSTSVRKSTTSPKIPPPTTPHATFATSNSKSRGNASSGRGTGGGGGSISRSISACNRCRARKTKCDQLFPSCTACTRAGVQCVGIDAATGREIPRSYVDWMEKRVKFLEEQLQLREAGEGGKTNGLKREAPIEEEDVEKTADKALRLRPDIQNLVDQVGLVGVQGTSSPGFLGGSSGMSFARLMFAAVKMRGNENTQPSIITSPLSDSAQVAPPRPNPPDPSVTSTTIPKSRQRTSPIPFPPRKEAKQLMDTYFQQANPQFPILFRPSFEKGFNRACDCVEREGRNPRPMGADADAESIQHSADLYFTNMCFAIAAAMSTSSDNLPERYHATAMRHMDSLFSSISASNDRLNGLKGILLLALYSMMRPAAPGVWYVLGAALRLMIDLGLHQESKETAEKLDPVALDERRRLFWCTYSIDRQVCVYLGRPFGIADDAIKVEFPLDVSDECITVNGLLPEALGKKSSRTISILMFRCRRLQSEIQQVLYQASEVPRKFKDVDEWRRDMEARVQAWIDDAPKNQSETGSGYNLSFVDLNYQQTRLLLYGLSPAVPMPSVEALEIIADSGSRIIQAYRHLHREKKINYTWLSCHNLFIAGTSYLCALWHSPQVRAATTIDQIDFNTLACVDVLSSMIDRCPAAQTCRDVFSSLASSTVQLCTSELATRPKKRTKTDDSTSPPPPSTTVPIWTPSPSDVDYSPTPQPVPASLANILQAPTPPPPPYSFSLYQQSQHQQVDPLFRQQQHVSPFLQMDGADMQPLVDGSRLYEMIREVGAAGGWDVGLAANVGWGFEQNWAGM